MTISSRRPAALVLALFVSLSFLSLIAPGTVGAQQQHPRFERGFNENRLFDLSEIDQVNLFNGNLSLSIPIGLDYPLGGDRSFQIRLVYNSKVWDIRRNTVTGDELIPFIDEAEPDPYSNAGLGWSLHFGRLLAPRAIGNESGEWLYLSPDGAEHTFHLNLTPGSSWVPGVLYSRDGSRLRLRLHIDGRHEIGFPDGEIHRFTPVAEGASGSLREIVDPHGNTLLTVSYNSTFWVITDRFRSYTVILSNRIYNGVTTPFVEEVRVPKFGGGHAIFTFLYSTSTEFLRPCYEQRSAQFNSVEAPRLESLLLPDGTRYEFSYNNDLRTCDSGTLQQMTLPTRGVVAYAYGEFEFGLPCPEHHGGPQEVADPSGPAKTPAVVGRSLVSDEGVHEWSYRQFLDDPGNTLNCLQPGLESPFQHSRVEVVDPLGHKRHHYFSIWQGRNPSPSGLEKVDYGLPFTRVVRDPISGLGLSSETFDCSAVDCGAPIRSTYVEYEADVARAARPTLKSEDRVIATATPFFRRYARVVFAMARTTAFSVTPSSVFAPGSIPPCPGSRTTRGGAATSATKSGITSTNCRRSWRRPPPGPG